MARNTYLASHSKMAFDAMAARMHGVVNTCTTIARF